MKGRWERDMKSKEDKQQGRFDEHGWMKLPEQPKVEVAMKVNPNEQVFCPFCLYQGKLAEFFVSTKKGISQGNAECPKCKNGMRMKTLIADMTPAKFAEFIFEYGRKFFWQKCKFETWKSRLAKLGWAGQFWTRYNELKGEVDVEQTIDNSREIAERYERQAGNYGEEY